jgi:excisionase family DNA binding protein
VPEELLTVAEAARRMGVSAKVVQTLVDYEQLPSVPVGTRRRIPVQAVEEYVRLGEQAAAFVRSLLAPPRPPTSKEYRP